MIGGTSNVRDIKFKFEMIELHVHPLHSRENEYDIAVFKAKENFLKNPVIKVATLPPLCKKSCCYSCPFTVINVAGFGYSEPGKDLNQLKKIKQVVVSREECQRAWKESKVAKT